MLHIEFDAKLALITYDTVIYFPLEKLLPLFLFLIPEL